MIKLNNTQLAELDKFIKHYIGSSNAASGSMVDQNANVTQKNAVTMNSEMLKPIQIQLNRYRRSNQIEKDFDIGTSQQYLQDIDKHCIYCHDESHQNIPYCCSISLFPFLNSGSVCIGGNTEKPKHLSSFCGGFINLINQIASQVAGAVATPSFLVCFDYFARKDYGEDYLKTHTDEIQQYLQGVVYYLNEPASGRDSQSVFWNLSMFDRFYMKELYGDFAYPDEQFSKVNFKSVENLQKFFIHWFNQERTKKLLTFPVITAAMVYDENKQIKDKSFRNFIAKEFSEGNSFFVYLSPNVDSLSSCCRLRNESKNEFSYTLGNIGEMTGSVHVITMNMNRIVQDAAVDFEFDGFAGHEYFLEFLHSKIAEQVRRIHKYHVSTRNIYKQLEKEGMYPIYTANFIQMSRQFSTIGINGLVEAAEFLGYEISPNQKYIKFCSDILKVISDLNKEAKAQYGVMFNTEFVPAESAGHKFSKWDQKDGYEVPRDCYNSYFYKVEDSSLTILDKIRMHGNEVTQYLNGGSAAHFNLEEYLDPEQYEKLFEVCCILGLNYFCFNVLVTCCEDEKCGYIDKRTLNKCSKCGSKNIVHATRIIGYLKKISNFSEARQEEARKRYRHANTNYGND
jgi:ribonucleoside-triphosphate reductase (formate)